MKLIAATIKNNWPRGRRQHGGKLALLVLITVAASLSWALFGARAGTASGNASPAPRPAAKAINPSGEPAPSPRTPQADGVEVKSVTLTPGGFEPKVLLARPQFILSLTNMTWLDGAQVQLLRQPA